MRMRRSFRRGRFGASGGGSKPTRDWVSLNAGWILDVAVTTASPLITLQAPTTLALTSDPPEDLTVLRIVGDFSVTIQDSGDGFASWTLALIRQDTPFTPTLLWQDDADKRILWSRTYFAQSTVGTNFTAYRPPGTLSYGPLATPTMTVLGEASELTHIDIAPKVRLTAGQGLYLVAYENAVAFSSNVTTASQSVRMLYQRSRRR